MAIHRDVLSAECHEPKYITGAVIADHGKVLTPSSTVNAVSELVRLEVLDLSDAATVATLLGVQTLSSKRVTPRLSAVTYAATINVNADLFDVLSCASLTGNVTVGAPTGTAAEGQPLTVRLTQDATGGRTITYNAAFITTGATVTTLSTTETRLFLWHGGRARWIQVAFTSGI